MAAVGLVALLLAACGGGGGGGSGGSGGSGSDFRVTLATPRVDFDFSQGAWPAPVNVRVTASGTPPATLFVGAVVEGAGLDPVIPATLSETEATFSVSARPNLAPGTYTGRLLLSACTESACTNRIGGSPLAVPYTVVVRANLGVNTSRVMRTVTGGQADDITLTVELPTGVTSLHARMTTPAPWVAISQPAAGQVRLDFQPWREGFYNSTLELTAGSQSVLVPVDYTVTQPAGGERDLSASASSLTLSTTENVVGPVQTVSTTAPSWAPTAAVTSRVEYPPASATGWLQVTPRGNNFDVAADASALQQGFYTAALVLRAPAPAAPVVIPVSLTVGPGLVAPAAQNLAVGAETTAAQLQGTLPVRVAAGPALAWTATSSQPWLELTTASGTTGQNLAWRVAPATVAAMDNFSERTATVTLRSALAHVSPVSFDVTLAKRLPEVQGLGPYLVFTGQRSSLVIRGRGFAGVGDLASRLQIGGLGAGTPQRLSDTELRVDVNPVSAGPRATSVANALGLTPATATLQVLAPQTLASAVIPAAGIKRALVYDAQRQALLAVNVENETLQRARWNGSSWVVDARSIAGLLDAGLGPDGSSIIVSSTPGRIQLLSPETLATEFSLDVPGGLARNFSYLGFGISTTNDGRSWLATGDGNWNELASFDHLSRTMQPRPSQPELRTSFYGGPWTMVSRDGSRLLVPQSGAITPQPLALYRDTSDGLLRENPAGLTFFYDAQLSDDGNRVLFDSNEVRDRDFALVGRVPPEDFSRWVVMGRAMSPDGSRAYVMAYPDPGFGDASAVQPKVLVYDSSTMSPLTSVLPKVGEFNLPSYPGCRNFFSTDSGCRLVVRSTISPDGRTLFFAGDTQILVVPVPAELRSASSAAAQRARAQRAAPRVTPWATGAIGRTR